MSKVTEKNTKKEIMDYVRELEAKLAEKSEARKTTEDVKRETKVKEIQKSAAELIATGIVNEKTEAQYNDLLETIKMKDKELKEVYEIERTANTLEALLITYQDKNETLLKEYNEKSLELQNEFETKKAKWDEELKQCQKDHDKLVKDLKALYAEEKAELDKKRAREKEEYVYNLNRERDRENDEWADEKAQREAALKAKEDAVAEREANVDKLETSLEESKELIAILEKEKVEEYNKGFDEGKAKAKKEADTSKVFSDKSHKAELERKEDRIASLTSALEEARRANESLQNKLDEAYAQITNTAMAVANAGVKVTMDTNK